MIKKINIGFVGDICLAREYKTEGFLEGTFNHCRKLNELVDLSFANFECCVTPDSVSPARMGVPEKELRNIVDAGFDVFNLANNHIMDYGENVMFNTKRCLMSLGHHAVGVGNDTYDAVKPVYVNRNETVIAFIGACDRIAIAATDSKSGVAPLNENLISSAIAEAKSVADIIVVSIHADLEFTNYPAPWRVRLSRRLAESGADVIIQHHSHTLQGAEYHKGSLIVYSLGNFAFPLSNNEYQSGRNGHVSESIYLTVFIEISEINKSIRHKIIPIVINKRNIPELALDLDKVRIEERFLMYSSLLKSDKFLRNCYFKRCGDELLTYFREVYYSIRKKKFKSTLLSPFKNRNYSWLKGVISFGYF